MECWEELFVFVALGLVIVIELAKFLSAALGGPSSRS